MLLGRVLLVDDEPVLRRVMRRALERAGIEVLEAANGHEALELIRHHYVDAVVSDVRMPQLGGLQLLERLLGHDPDLPVVLVSGSTEVETRSDALAIGAFDYLQKPLELVALQTAVLRAIEARSRRGAQVA